MGFQWKEVSRALSGVFGGVLSGFRGYHMRFSGIQKRSKCVRMGFMKYQELSRDFQGRFHGVSGVTGCLKDVPEMFQWVSEGFRGISEVSGTRPGYSRDVLGSPRDVMGVP